VDAGFSQKNAALSRNLEHGAIPKEGLMLSFLFSRIFFTRTESASLENALAAP
jgi:hypothetical protein